MYTILFEIRESLLIALHAIRANKMRSILTMLGIFIGVTVVVLMSTAIKGIDNSFQTGMSALGSDVLYIDKWSWFEGGEWWKMRNRRRIDMDDYNNFKEQAKLPLATAPVINSRQTVKFVDNRIDNVFLNGSTTDYLQTTNFTFSLGRFYSETESNAARYVAPVGSHIANTLFPRGDALDKEIKIGGVNFKVVGVLDEQGSWILGSFNPDKQVFIPIGTIFKNFQNQSFGTITINVRAPNPMVLEETKKEIGIRKAIGAKRRTILGQFLFESSFICLVGGLVGLLAAVLLSKMVNQFLPTSVQWDAVVIAILVSVITGLVAGLAPAYTAAKLDPVEALRYE